MSGTPFAHFDEAHKEIVHPVPELLHVGMLVVEPLFP